MVGGVARSCIDLYSDVCLFFAEIDCVVLTEAARESGATVTRVVVQNRAAIGISDSAYEFNYWDNFEHIAQLCLRFMAKPDCLSVVAAAP